MARTRNNTKTTITREDAPRVNISQFKTDFRYLEEQYPGKAFRLVNNEQGRIQKFMQQGWQPVEGESQNNIWSPNGDVERKKGSVIQIPVGPGRTVDAMDAVLMMIDKELFQEYEDMKSARLDQMDKALKGGAGQADGVGSIETYAPNLPTGGVGFESK